ncbi:hypothetical protein EW145_g1728 [Phellinidium pouzarii]|uniref:Polyketide synthase-like phosphopantetheine-binding domain-containing protein n=1 Tax=Phellinidium pouzarii TaxID=167371 RepID=A0A4S4LDD5_9AGAM|nr:hypothetical protein EW145_g1728 [Phellinidium pouzarii]
MSLATDSFRTPQAVGSKTFTAPPLNGSLALHQLYDFHASHSPDHPLYVFATPQGDVKTMTWADVQRGIHRASIFASKFMPGVQGNHKAPPTVAILANTDMITFQCFLLGLIRSGIQPFPISIRNSAVGVANMFVQTTAAHLFVSADEAMQGVSKGALKEIDTELSKNGANKEKRQVKILAMPTFEDLFPEDDSNASFELLPPTERPDLDSPALILHSSASYSHLAEGFGERDLHGEIMAVHALPLFRRCLWVFPHVLGSQPPIGLTPDRQLASAIATGATLMFGIPHFLDAWSTEPKSVEFLQGLNGVVFGGAPLSKSVGDFLQSKNVPLWHIYGGTEMGVITTCMPKRSIQYGWEYIFFSPHINPAFVAQHQEPESGKSEDIYELVIKPCATHTPSVTNMTHDGQAAYATSDLLIPHPHVEGLYKIHGRTDDQIMLSSGEKVRFPAAFRHPSAKLGLYHVDKTNPGPMEHIITRSPLVTNALMFGRGRFQNGVIIEPATPFDPTEDGGRRLAEFRNDIWPYIEQANAFAPTHSRIFKEMIIITKPSKPFEYTPKGNPRRHVSVALYNEEIDQVYAAVEAQADSGPSPPANWNLEDSLEYVRTLVARVLKNSVRDEDDLFEFGCDSLQATWIRNSIIHAFRQTSTPTDGVGSSFVFEYPSVALLGQEITRIAQSRDKSTVRLNRRGAYDDLTSLVIYELEYCVYVFLFRPHCAHSETDAQDVVQIRLRDCDVLTDRQPTVNLWHFDLIRGNRAFECSNAENAQAK